MRIYACEAPILHQLSNAPDASIAWEVAAWKTKVAPPHHHQRRSTQPVAEASQQPQRSEQQHPETKAGADSTCRIKIEKALRGGPNGANWITSDMKWMKAIGRLRKQTQLADATQCLSNQTRLMSVERIKTNYTRSNAYRCLSNQSNMTTFAQKKSIELARAQKQHGRYTTHETQYTIYNNTQHAVQNTQHNTHTHTIHDTQLITHNAHNTTHNTQHRSHNP